MTPLEQAILLGLGEQQKRSSAKDEVGILHQCPELWQPIAEGTAVSQWCKAHTKALSCWWTEDLA